MTIRNPPPPRSLHPQVCTTLVDAGFALEALPVLALWEHVAYYATRLPSATVLCRWVGGHGVGA